MANITVEGHNFQCIGCVLTLGQPVVSMFYMSRTMEKTLEIKININ